MNYQESFKLMHDRLDAVYGKGEVDAMTRLVMDEILHCSPVDLVLRADHEVPEFFPAKLEQIIARLERQEPIQHILGVAQFHGHRFTVTPDTLVPRPETEQLVDLVIDECGDREDLRILDVGTGTGCIAISLARALRFAQVSAIDVSVAALAVAQENAQALKTRIKFVRADILSMPLGAAASLDIVVSNPPYVCLSEQAQMERNVLDYEPHIALFVPDDDPLLYYRSIALHAANALTSGGKVYLEVNRRFADEVADLLQHHGFIDARVIRDTFNNARFVTATQPI
ncbi:MAG: peptide chain release factor N(5)-glutamine methyltransferase [Muribaculaceae bacterium]|nr:peptide chain release factor N(5)-glutamine methyltransferase [Muribaculaceae bacterium]